MCLSRKKKKKTKKTKIPSVFSCSTHSSIFPWRSRSITEAALFLDLSLSWCSTKRTHFTFTSLLLFRIPTPRTLFMFIFCSYPSLSCNPNRTKSRSQEKILILNIDWLGPFLCLSPNLSSCCECLSLSLFYPRFSRIWEGERWVNERVYLLLLPMCDLSILNVLAKLSTSDSTDGTKHEFIYTLAFHLWWGWIGMEKLHRRVDCILVHSHGA